MDARRRTGRSGDRSMDLTLLPLDARLPWRVGAPPAAVVPMDEAGHPSRRARGLRFTIGASLMGTPAVALRIGHARTGAPIGVQVFGPGRAELDLLEAAAWIESLGEIAGG